MNEFDTNSQPQSIEDKRNRKYLAKFAYRPKLICKKCPTGMMMGTPSFPDAKGQRTILKYLRNDEVRRNLIIHE